MTPTIVDTSTLIILAQAERNTSIRNKDAYGLRKTFGGIDEAIQAFILHDNLLFDGPSLRRNVDRLPELMKYCGFGKTLCEEDLTLEQRVYESMLKNHFPTLRKPEGTSEFFRMHTEDSLATEVEAGRYYPSTPYRDIASELTPQGQLAARALLTLCQSFSKDKYSGAACETLLRTLYYDQLQQLTSANLVLHPLKGQFMGWIKADGSYSGQQYHSDSWTTSRSILSMFDKSARRAFYERKQKWLGRGDLTYDVPMLTSYVLNKCSTWADLPKTISEVRESKQAREFRRATKQLLDASKNHDNREVDETLNALSSAADRWSIDLHEPTLKKKVKVSVPLVGIGIDVDVPDFKLNKNTADRLLVFVHMILSNS